MCGRFTLSSNSNTIRQQFKLAGNDLHPEPPMHWNITPNQPVLAITPRTMHSAHNHSIIARWGFIPEWAKGENDIGAKRQNLSFFESHCLMPVPKPSRPKHHSVGHSNTAVA